MRFFYVYKHEGAGTAQYGLKIIFSSKAIHCWQKFREFLKNPITSSQKRQSFWLNLCNPKALIGVLESLKIIAILKADEYDLLHQIHRSKASCLDKVTCTNGCCRNNPCLNEGTCNEICEPTSVRYNCSCPVQFVGRHCEIQLRKSCQGYKAAGISVSGLYKIIDDDNETFQVFCDFDSEPGFAWNLIQSFSFSKKDLMKVTCNNEIGNVGCSSVVLYFVIAFLTSAL